MNIKAIIIIIIVPLKSILHGPWLIYMLCYMSGRSLSSERCSTEEPSTESELECLQTKHNTQNQGCMIDTFLLYCFFVVKSVKILFYIYTSICLPAKFQTISWKSKVIRMVFLLSCLVNIQSSKDKYIYIYTYKKRFHNLQCFPNDLSTRIH